MDGRLAAVFAAQGGVASSADAARLGARAVQLDALVRSHQLVRVRRGAYVLKETHDGADVWGRYRLRTKAILRTRPDVDRRCDEGGPSWRGSTSSSRSWSWWSSTGS